MIDYFPIRENILYCYYMEDVSRREDYNIIEEIEREVRRLFGNNDVCMPISDFLQITDNIKSKRKIVIKRKKMIQ